MMRPITLFTALLPLLVWQQPLQAREAPKEIFLSASSKTQGIVGSREQQSYVLKVDKDSPVTFEIAADSLACGYELASSAQRGYLASANRFPARHTEQANPGDTFTISFFQSRASWIADSTCAYSFSVH